MIENGRLIAARYRVTRHLGSGAQGDVYEVEDTVRTGRLALKLIPLHQANGARIDAIKQEFAVLASLRHPNVVQVRDFGVAARAVPDAGDEDDCSQGWYYTADLIDGKELLEATEAASPELLVRLGIQIAEALRYVHGRGVLHRDIKPANILVDPSGHVRVMDFGLALATAARDPGPGRAGAFEGETSP